MADNTPADETPEVLTPAQIAEQIERLPEITDPAELEALSAGIRSAYQASRFDPDGNDLPQVDVALLATLTDALKDVSTRQGEIAQEQADAKAELDRLDGLVAGTVEEITLSAEDAAEFDGWSDDELAAVAGWGETEFGALAAHVEAEASTPTEPDPEPEQPAEAPAEETVRAASAPRTVYRQMPASPAQPQPAADGKSAIVGSLARNGQDATETEVFQEFYRTAQSLGGPGGRRRAGQEIPVASINLSADFPRMDADEDPEAFYARQLGGLRQRRGQGEAAESLVRQAAGTLCAPPLVDYAVPVIGSDAQPIAGVFPAAAGGTAAQMKTLSFVQAMTFDDFTDVTTDTTWGSAGGGATADTVGIGAATATQNALALDDPTSPYPKLALQANCPTFVSCEQRAVWLEILYDNLGSMAWPEFVAAVRRGGDIALADYMDALRLQDWFDAAELAGNDLGPIAQPVNANQNYLRSILNIVMTDRSNKRDWDTPYVVVQPAFVDGILAAEQLGTAAIAAGQRAITEARDQIARDYNISFTNYLGRFGVTAEAYTTDNSNDTRLPALPGDGSTPDMPCQVRVGIARDDAGFNRIGDTLNLGVLRTETDLENNNWRTFYETWQRLCFRIPPIVADIQVNPNMLVMGYEHNPQGTSLDFCVGAAS